MTFVMTPSGAFAALARLETAPRTHPLNRYVQGFLKQTAVTALFKPDQCCPLLEHWPERWCQVQGPIRGCSVSSTFATMMTESGRLTETAVAVTEEVDT
jgi:hypothetical protein